MVTQAEWRSLFCTLGTQHSNTVVAQQACRSSCDSPPEELAVDATLPAGITSSTHLIHTQLWCKSRWSRFGFKSGGGRAAFNPEGMENSFVCVLYLEAEKENAPRLVHWEEKKKLAGFWLLSHQLEFPLQLEHPLLKFSLVFVLPHAHLHCSLCCICLVT